MNKRGSYLRNIVVLGIGSIIAQMFNLLSQPVLTRLVSPEVLGQYSYIASLANIVIPVASLKIDQLVVKEKDDVQAQYITDVCLLSLVLVSSVFGIIIGIGYAINSFEPRSYGGVVFLAIPLVATEGLRYIVSSYCNRYGDYKKISTLAITREGSRAILQIADALLTKSVVGQTAAHVISPIFGIRAPLKDYIERKKSRSGITFKKVKEILIGARHQILFLAPSQFFNTFAYSYIAVSIASLYSDEVLGYYSISIKILGLPMIFITTNISKVIFKSMADKMNANEICLSFFLKNALGLAVISLAGFTVLYFIGPTACELIFGEGYYVAGTYIKLLCLMYATRFISTSFSGLFTVFNKQLLELGFNVALFAGTVATGVVAGKMNLGVTQYFTGVNIVASIIYFVQVIIYGVVIYRWDKAKNREQISSRE